MKLSAFLYMIIFACCTFVFAQSDVYNPEAERVNDLKHTKLKVSFDYQEETMFGNAWITLSPHFYATDSLTLDAKGMLIHEVKMESPKKSNLNYTYVHNKLKIKLDKTYTKDESYTIFIKYTARPNEVKEKGSVAISQAKGLYFIDPQDKAPNKPTQIWTQGEPEASSCWFPTIDALNQKSTQELYMTVPTEYVTLSNGTLISQTSNADGTRTDYWKQTQKHAPYLFFMGVGDFAIIKDKWKNIPVDYYVEHEYAPYAQEIFGHTPEMITFFSDKFGYEYPWDKYSQIVVRDYVSGAMENTTAVIHLDRAQQKHGQLVDENVWENTIAHELAHHWFGDLVTTESWANLTLNESFANYSEYLWQEFKYGKASADEHRYEDLQGYFFGENKTKHLVRFNFDDKEDMFDAVTYNKGGYILHMLRSYLGDEAFFAGLKKYLHDNAYGKAEAHELRIALEEVSGKDLNWFFNQWYYGSGHPELLIVTEKLNGKTQVNIRQNQSQLFEFPLAIDIIENGKAKRHQVWIEKKAINTFEFDISNPELIVVNADNDLLAEITHDYSTEEYVKLYHYAKDEYTHRMLAVEALSAVQLTNDLALQTLSAALDDPYQGIREQVLNSLDISDSKVQNQTLHKVTEIAQNDPETVVQAAALTLLGDLKDTHYLNLFKKALKSESFSVQAAGLVGLLNLDKNSALTLAKTVDDEVINSSQKLVAIMIPEWKAQNDTSHFDSIAELAAFYAFVAMQNPEMAQPAKEAFIWIMETDSPLATSKILKMQKEVYDHLKSQQPMALPFIKQMIENGLKIKTEAAKNNPSKSLEKQVEEIQNLLSNLD